MGTHLLCLLSQLSRTFSLYPYYTSEVVKWLIFRKKRTERKNATDFENLLRSYRSNGIQVAVFDALAFFITMYMQSLIVDINQSRFIYLIKKQIYSLDNR